MNNWSAGYVSEIAYTHGYYRELSPVMMDFAMLCNQQQHRVQRPLRYLELGFGQGVSLAVHAASCSGEFWGTDFNPVHAANAKDLAGAAGANVHIFDDSFEELAKRPDLPEFDVIVLHGIWSWVNDENRKIIVDIARRKLAVGGLLYVSYNCTPGWSAAMPLRHLLSLHVEMASDKSTALPTRIDSALNFAQSVMDSGSNFFKMNPAVGERIKRMKDQNKNYLAHEFFNADWHPMPFSEVAEQLGEAKLSFAASGFVMDHIPSLNLTAEAQKLLKDIQNPILRESVRDYCTGTQFRRDIWVKGARNLFPLEQGSRMMSQRFVLLIQAKEIPSTIQTVLGEANLQQEVYGPVAEILAANGHTPKTLKEMSEALPKLQATRILQAILVLIGAGYVHPAQDEAEVMANLTKCEGLNRHLLNQSIHVMDSACLASPVIGGGVSLARVNLWIIKAIKDGARTEEQIIDAVWGRLEQNSQRLTKDGRTLETPEENKAHIQVAVREFSETKLSIMRALRIL